MATRSVARSCLQGPSSTALSFLQFTPRRYGHSHPPPLLDFLVPRLQTAPRHHVEGRRGFADTARRQQTRAILNAQKDEDGKDMNIEITPRAASRLKEIMTKDSNPNLALRISVESGGCHGFQYLLSLSSLPPLEKVPSTLNTSSHDSNTALADPTLGSEKISMLEEDDVVFADEGSGAKVVIDAPSLELLKGSKVEYTTSLIGNQFQVVNPSASSSCGCGTSFDIKF